MAGRRFGPFEKPVPGPLFVWVKRLSWIELAIFSGLIFFWLVPGFETETMLFGWFHGIGFVGLCIVIWIACIRHEAPYTLLAATLTPVGPVGSVIGIAGMAGSVGGTMLSLEAGHILQLTHSYNSLFILAGSVYLVAFVCLQIFAPGLKRVNVPDASASPTR